MLQLEPYLAQLARWPQRGRHVLAQFDAETIVVYQAYRPELGLAAARDGRFSAAWSRSRMSWVKPNFLWMMYRCGWATKADQEVVLAIRILRAGFDAMLAAAVPSSFDPRSHDSREAWSRAVETSDVRVQWDPDHDPFGAPCERRALQLGLRGEALRRFADAWLVSIEDVTPFVREQHARLREGGLAALVTPREDSYPFGP